MVVAKVGQPNIVGKGQILVIEKVTGPASYSTGGFTVTLSQLRKIHQAVAICNGSYKVGAISISGNSITIPVEYYDYDAAADGTAIEVPAGTDLSAVEFLIIALGE